MIRVVKQILILVGFLCFSPSIAQVSFIAVGDILLDRGVRESIVNNNSILYPFEKTRHIINDNDIAFFNLECPITSIDKGYPLPKRNSFRANPEFAQGLVWGGFNLASLANNHTIDWGKDGLMETIQNLLSNKIAPLGAASNQVDAFKPVIYNKDGVYIAFFAVLDFLLEATTFIENEPYPAYGNVDYLISEIKKYRSIVDNIVVSFHWGQENVNYPHNGQVENARKVIDAGADLVLGHHPHVIQGIDTYKGKLICYSLGSFIFDGITENQNETFAFKCDFTKNGLKNPRLIPLVIKNNRPEVALQNEAKRIVNNIEKYSKSMKTTFHLDNENVIWINKEKSEDSFWKLTLQNHQFLFFPKRIDFVDSSQSVSSFQIPDPDYIFSNVTYDIVDNTLYFYTIVSNKIEEYKRLAIFPFCLNSKKFLKPSLDINKHYNPWKITMIDIDNNGSNDLVVGTYKTTKYFNEYENRVFVFNVDRDYIYPKWLGSKIGHSIINFEVIGDVVAKSNKLKIVQNNIENNSIMINHFIWNGFGFSFDKAILEYYYNNTFSFDNFFNYDFTLITLK